MSSIKFSQLKSLTVLPTDTIFPVVSSGTNYKVTLDTIKSYVTPSWNAITGKPTFNTVAFSGLYADLSGKPTIPVIPTLVSAFTNDRGYLTTVDYTQITNAPQFAAVATSGNWLDIVNKPNWLSTTNVGYLYNDGSGTLSFQSVQSSAGGGSGATGWQLTSGTSVISLTSDGNLVPATDLQQDLGSPTNRFRHVYVSSGTIYLGDLTISDVNGELVATNTVTNKVISLTDTQTQINARNAQLIWNDNGVLEFPGNTVYIKAANSPFYSNFYVDGGTNETGVTGMPDHSISLHTYQTIGVPQTVHKHWYFNADGTITFPDGSTQFTAGGLLQSATVPASTSTSTLWYDTVGGRSYVYFDNSWVDASPMPTIDTTQLVNNGYSLSIDSSGVVNLPTFSGSPSIAIVQTASAGIGLNANGTYFNFNQNGSLTFPDGGRVVLHPYGNSYIESVDYGITTSTSSLNIFAGPDQKITLRANFGGTEKFWTFGLDGSLTWPDTSVQTGASISIADLKTIITTCTNFTEFKNAILGL